MTEKTRFIDARRRGFLKGGAAAVAGAGVAGEVLAGGDKDPTELTPETPAPKSQGYRETEHVREYYARARY